VPLVALSAKSLIDSRCHRISSWYRSVYSCYVTICFFQSRRSSLLGASSRSQSVQATFPLDNGRGQYRVTNMRSPSDASGGSYTHFVFTMALSPIG